MNFILFFGLLLILVYVKHVCYVNFTRFNLPKPIYVNLVRDPVERIISWFYYIRAPW
jgi:dermatan/chondrotin sulfate uronyl 2-O-sulfotransferase UST